MFADDDVHLMLLSRIKPMNDKMMKICAQGKKSMTGNIACGRTNSKNK